MTDLVTTRSIRRIRGEADDEVVDDIVVEEPLEIRLGGTAIAVLMRTPGHDQELVTGFALTEGIALTPTEVVSVNDLGEGRIDLVLGVEVDPERFRRNLYATSSCGVCGKATIDAVRIAARRAQPGPVVASETLVSLPGTLRDSQAAFARTGGLHAAAAFSGEGRLLASFEDVGRHNAVDKVVGHISGEGWPVVHPVLFVSGRVSFEIIQKAAVAGFRLVAGVSAPSSLAIDLADELGITLVGFVRDAGCNVYTAGERVG